MKICHVVNDLSLGGAERLILDLAVAQSRLGHQVFVVTIGTSVRFEVPPEISIHRLGRRKYDPRSIFDLRTFAGRHEIDVIHAHLAPAVYFAFAAHHRVVITEHAEHNRRWNYLPIRLLDAWVYSQCRAVICISQGVKAKLEHLGVRKDKLRLIPNGISRERIEVASQSDVPPLRPGPILGMVSRFSPQKNHMAVLELAAVMPESTFILVGGGELFEPIKERARALNLENVVFTGPVANPYPFMRTFDVGLQLSHSEGFGLAALEMMSLGVPVILSDVPGLNELNPSPLIVPFHKTPDQTASWIRRLLANPTEYRNHQERCRAIAASYDLSMTVKAYLEAYAS